MGDLKKHPVIENFAKPPVGETMTPAGKFLVIPMNFFVFWKISGFWMNFSRLIKVYDWI